MAILGVIVSAIGVTWQIVTSNNSEIPVFEGQLKDEDQTKAFSLAHAFNKFISDNDGKIIKLDVFEYYLHSELDTLKLLDGGFPDPREFSLADSCENGHCSGYEYKIVGNLDEINYNPSATAKFIRGYFRVNIVAAFQGWVVVKLKHVSDEHIDLITRSTSN